MEFWITVHILFIYSNLMNQASDALQSELCIYLINISH